MDDPKRRSVAPVYSMCVQPAFLIGTDNEDGIACSVSRGAVLDVPVLDRSRRVYECEVSQTVETGDSATFFCPIRNIQMDERPVCADPFDVDLTVLDPVIYSGKYHSLGAVLGSIGDFP